MTTEDETPIIAANQITAILQALLPDERTEALALAALTFCPGCGYASLTPCKCDAKEG